MSSKKKNSLLNRVLGKGKDADEEGGGGKGKKGKKGKLEKQPSIRESVHSERRQTMHSVTHASEAPLHYEEDEYHHGAPVTAVHEEDPYSPFDDGGSYMREPSAINVRPASHVHLGHQSMGHQSGGDYFEQPFSESPRAHPNVISLGEHAHPGHAEPEAHVAIAGVSRQPTILSPHHQSTEAPRMLKPGDQMEIDPRNPPTFVVDEGVTLEIGDEENGFVPYEQYLANLAKQPPPSTGGTYIVQGGGDVVIQDENGDVIKTIPGTGAMAGRGEPQIHHVNGSTIVVL